MALRDEDRHNLVSGGTWWRFDRYVLDGDVIRPAAGAKATPYEPWLIYEQARRRRGGASRGQPAPYQELLQLGAQLEQIEHEYYEVVPRRLAKLVLSWSRRNGLLGLLPHTLLLVAGPTEPESQDATDTWSRIEFGAGHWGRAHSRVARSAPQRALARQQPASWRTPLSELLPAQGGVLIRPSPGPEYLVQPFSAVWARYFRPESDLANPRVAELDFAGEHFWREYGEPLDDFARCVLLMYWTIRAITHPEAFDPEMGAYPTSPGWGYLELNQLASVASLAGHPSSPGKTALSWNSPSLIGSFAVMMLSDLAGGSQVRICTQCGAPFLSAAYRAFYCSPRCKATAAKQRQRANAKQERDTAT
jgi:hypothetical protein